MKWPKIVYQGYLGGGVIRNHRTICWGSMLKRIILTTLSVIVINGCSYQRTESPCYDSMKLDENTDYLEYLKSSKCFRIGGVGAAAVTPSEEIALRRLMRQDNALESLTELFDEGSPPGKLYALLGLRYVDQMVFNELSIELRNRNDMVETQGGCIIFQASVCNILKSIEDGAFDIYMEREL